MKEPIFYRFIRPLLYLWFNLKYKPIVINKKEIPKKGKVILAGNHSNNLDCFSLGYSTYRCVRFVAKSELAKGLTLKEALLLQKDDVTTALGGLPENKVHCSLIGITALQNAIENYYSKK